MDAPGRPNPARRKKNKAKLQQAGGADKAKASALHSCAATGASKKRGRKEKRQQLKIDTDDTVGVQADAPQQVQPPPRPAAAPGSSSVFTGSRGPPTGGGKKGKGSGSLLQQMRARLQGGRFRWLNEALYTSDGATALGMVRREPELMQQYHEGFREQTKSWPVQPVDQAIAWLRRRPSSWTVADLGCGDARVAASLAPHGYTVHSFDLVATAPGVVACNMAAVPLGDHSVDAAVFCLSLMGTDYGSFLEEAARILKPTGWLWIAEVQSRLVGADGSSVLPKFEAALRTLGFAVRRKDTANSHFLVVEAQREGGGGGKAGKQQQGQQQQGQQGQQGGGGTARPVWPELRACQYKKR